MSFLSSRLRPIGSLAKAILISFTLWAMYRLSFSLLPDDREIGLRRMRKVIVLGHGGIQDDHPTWITHDLCEVLQDSDNVASGLEPKIETRADVKRHQKEKGIVETHGTRLGGAF